MSVLSSRQAAGSMSRFLSVLVLLALSACANLAPEPVQPVQSPNDERQYRLVTLENELQVLLISSPGTQKAAAAMDVGVGSANNPPGRGGLAHFLEHMLFLGTDKYPDAAEYERYLTEHGGSHNAYTAFEHTNYFFDVNAKYLPEALDRFAQFFIAPRFDAQYVDREKHAVQAEYQMGLKSDSRRGLDVLQEVMNPQHPFSQFAVGSLDTLADRPGSPVRKELIDFYHKHYSANAMRLVVLGGASLDQLEALVRPVFARVPDRHIRATPISAPAFRPGSLPLFVQVEPLATLRQLEVSFPIADYRQDYDVKPVSYLSNLIGHEGEGSLLSLLKRQGLAQSLSAGGGLSWHGGGLFSVNIALTAKGVAEHDRVVQLLFSYVDMLRRAGPRERIYQEQSQLADLDFRFQESVEPISYVRMLAGAMHDYKPVDVLQGPYVMRRYDEQDISGLLKSLVPENALVVLTDKGLETDKVTAHYQVPYAAQTVNTQQLSLWQTNAAAEELHLPAPNRFIAQDVSLVNITPDNPAVPTVALDTGRQQIWFRQDDEFRVPRGAIYINFRSAEVGQSVNQSAAAALFAALLTDSVNELAYPARLAGLDFSFYKHAQGVSLRVSGFNDKQPVLLRALLEAYAHPAFATERFTDIRRDMIRTLQNTAARRPSSQVMDDLREALLYGEWGEQAMIAALEKLDLNGLLDYAHRFRAAASAQVMIYGNYRPDIVQSVGTLVSGVLGDGSAPPLPGLKVLKLAPGELIQYSVAVPHDDSVVAWYLQGEGRDWSDRAAVALTAQIIKSGFFQQLRTEQQLGYVVSAFPWAQLDVPGAVLLVQSPVADAGAVARAMTEFLQTADVGLDASQFERHKAALISEIVQPDKNLWQRAEFYWQSIARKQWQFDSRRQLADAVAAISLPDWSAYYQRVFLQRPHALQVVAPGKWGILPPAAHRFDKAETIKKGHAFYAIE